MSKISVEEQALMVAWGTFLLDNKRNTLAEIKKMTFDEMEERVQKLVAIAN
jgi:hypothetical protein